MLPSSESVFLGYELPLLTVLVWRVCLSVLCTALMQLQQSLDLPNVSVPTAAFQNMHLER